MAMTVHLYLKANVQDIKGESTQVSLGRENSIECLEFNQKVLTARERGSGLATGRREYQPLTIVKRIDKASPLIEKALTQNQVIEGTFKFFRPNPAGDGTTQHFYTVTIKQGRLAAVDQYVPSTWIPASADFPPLERVEFVFNTIAWTYEDGGVTHEDTWSSAK
jgi:type VI secretion system secreted protein Hcp